MASHPHLHAHPFRLVLVTESPNPPTTEQAFLVCMGHRIQGQDPATVARNATLDGRLKGVSVLPYSPDPQPAKGQTKKAQIFQRPTRKQYRQMVRRMVRVMDFTDELSIDSLADLVVEAKTLLKMDRRKGG